MITELIDILATLWLILYIITIPVAILVFIIYKLTSKKKPSHQMHPEYVNYNPEWTWVEERQKWVHESQLAKNIHRDQTGPSYEEWKASQVKSKVEEQKPQKAEEPPKEEIKFTLVIPENIKQLIEERKWEEEQKHKAQSPKVETYQAPVIQHENREVPKHEPASAPQKPAFAGAYRATPLLTQNESRNFQVLKQAANRKGYIVNAKVRLMDLVNPIYGKDYQANRNKVQSKHVDFVVCDQNMNVKVIIELDDKTHDRPDRQERDKFVDEVLTATGYKIIHTRHITPDILDYV